MPEPLNLNALSPRQLATLLRKAGAGHITQDAIERDTQAGAPTNANGTLALIPYLAWLIREESDGS